MEQADRTSNARYPMLASRSPLSRRTDRRVRALLNRQTPEADEEARRLLTGVEASERGAEWYFLSGCLRYRKGHLTDATAFLDRACELGGDKVPEYRRVYDRILYMMEHPDGEASAGEASDGEDKATDRRFACFAADCCPDACAECCCEGLCEGACEGIGEACCEGCDCDCS